MVFFYFTPYNKLGGYDSHFFSTIEMFFPIYLDEQFFRPIYVIIWDVEK